QVGELYAVERPTRGRQLGKLGENLPAALRLLAQQLDVVRIGRARLEHALELLDDDRDGGERRAELVRGGGREAVELREVLLAREHQLGGGERVGEQARFLGDLPSIDANEAEREQEREPYPEHVFRRQDQRVIALPRKRHVKEHERGRAHRRKRTEQHGHPA